MEDKPKVYVYPQSQESDNWHVLCNFLIGVGFMVKNSKERKYRSCGDYETQPSGVCEIVKSRIDEWDAYFEELKRQRHLDQKQLSTQPTHELQEVATSASSRHPRHVLLFSNAYGYIIKHGLWVVSGFLGLNVVLIVMFLIVHRFS